MIASDTATGYTGYGFDGGSIPGYISPQYSGGGTVIIGNHYVVPFDEQPLIDIVPAPSPVTVIAGGDTNGRIISASAAADGSPDYTLWIVGGAILAALILTSGGSR